MLPFQIRSGPLEKYRGTILTPAFWHFRVTFPPRFEGGRVGRRFASSYSFSTTRPRFARATKWVFKIRPRLRGELPSLLYRPPSSPRCNWNRERSHREREAQYCCDTWSGTSTVEHYCKTLRAHTNCTIANSNICFVVALFWEWQHPWRRSWHIGSTEGRVRSSHHAAVFVNLFMHEENLTSHNIS